MDDPLNILVVEDSLTDFLFIQRHLRRQGITGECCRVASLQEFETALCSGHPDVALCDYTVPGMDFARTLAALHRHWPDVPVIVVSGSLGEERVVELLKQGVGDLVLKDNLVRLVPAIQRALRDVGERQARRTAELALKDSEERYRRIVETAHEGIWSTDPEGRINFVNPALVRMLGYSAEEMIGQLVERILFEEDVEDHRRRFAERRNGADDQYERRLRRKDGSECWCQVAATPMLGDRGEFFGSVCMLSDISGRKRAEAALRDSQVRANLILDTAPDAMLVVEPSGQIVRANIRAERMFGYPAGTLATMRIDDLLPERYRHGHSALRAHFLADPRPRPMGQNRALYALHRDGSEFPVEVSLGPLKMGGDWHTIVSVLDITERKRAEVALQAAKLAAENANRVKTSFLANMSHELRTPLNAVIGFAEMIEQRMFGDAAITRYADYARMIRQSGEHLLHLIGDILDMSRIETGRYQLRDEAVRWPEVVSESVAMMGDSAAGAKVKLMTFVPPDLPLCRCDRHAVKQVLINLISNAVKYGASGGRVTISVDISRETGISLVVRDYGKGIPADRLGEIFQPFNRGRHDTARPGESIGLGLSIVKHLIELHSGTISVDTAPDRGTAMQIWLPPTRILADKPPRATPAVTLASVQDQRNDRVASTG